MLEWERAPLPDLQPLAEQSKRKNKAQNKLKILQSFSKLQSMGQDPDLLPVFANKT